MLELNESNTKALFRRAQAWQGLKDLDKAMVRTSHTPTHIYSSMVDTGLYCRDKSVLHARDRYVL